FQFRSITNETSRAQMVDSSSSDDSDGDATPPVQRNVLREFNGDSGGEAPQVRQLTPTSKLPRSRGKPPSKFKPMAAHFFNTHPNPKPRLWVEWLKTDAKGTEFCVLAEELLQQPVEQVKRLYNNTSHQIRLAASTAL
ncbi:hypothetical protein AaE_004223, partial [Aphanomyces astaci]